MSHLVPRGPLSKSRWAFSDLLRLICSILSRLGVGCSCSGIDIIEGVAVCGLGLVEGSGISKKDRSVGGGRGEEEGGLSICPGLVRFHISLSYCHPFGAVSLLF